MCFDTKFVTISVWVQVDVFANFEETSLDVFLRHCIHENGTQWGCSDPEPLTTNIYTNSLKANTAIAGMEAEKCDLIEFSWHVDPAGRR